MKDENRRDFIKLVILFSCILVALSILNYMSLALDFLFYYYALVSFFVVFIAATCYLLKYYPQSNVFLIVSIVAIVFDIVFLVPWEKYLVYHYPGYVSGRVLILLFTIAMIFWAFAFWKTGESYFKKLAIFWAIYFATVVPIAFKVLEDVEFVIFFPMVIGILPGLALICAFRYELLSSKAGGGI